MTSENEKTVHQQSITEDEDPLSIEEALEHAENAAKLLLGHKAEVGPSVSWEMFDEEAIVVLAAEVRRLREAEALSWTKVYESHTNKLRETIRVMSTNEGKLHAKIAELETDVLRLRRIEAVHTCGGGPTPCGGCCECLERTYPEPHEHQRMSAKLARVEALPDRWKGRIMPPDDRWVHAALELEAALRD